MPGIGTIINTVAIVVGGVLGMFFGKFIKEEIRESITITSGIAVLFLGIAGAMEKMLLINQNGLESSGSFMMIISLVVGTLIGELIGIEDAFEKFGEWLKIKSGNASDKSFINAFLTASFTVCIGAMAIVGSIQDGLFRDPSTLIAKAILDLVIIFIMTASLGKGCIFSAIPVAILQGSVTILSGLLAKIMTETAQNYLSMVGSIMIFCVGVNLIWGKKVRVANMLPSIVIAVIWAVLM